VSLSVWEAVAVFLAGIAAGTINTVVGSGTLITFPTLLATGMSPLTANFSNTVGLVPGSLSGAWGYRAELRGQRPRLIRLGIGSLIGGAIGALLLFWLPSSAFKEIVPALIAIGLFLVVFGPQISRRVAARAEARGGLHEHGAGWVWPAIAGAGVYGGYFGAAQGVLLMAIMGIGIDDDLQRLNAVKNVLAAIVNGVAAVIFIGAGHVDWPAAGLLAVGSVIGGQIGSTVGRKLPAGLLRALIVVVGIAALVSFFV
jgi:uncharacterized membrane protein YfcA